VVRNDQGVAEAFVNLVPSYDKAEAKSDLMRHLPGSPRGLMDYLFLELIRELDRRGWQRLNLGLAPFSGLEDQSDRSLEEWFLNLLYRNHFKLFNFQGLRNYKQNFEPTWEPRYLIYEGGPTGLARIGLAANRLLEPPWRH
jgi:phosphatidylglycerol lysyltransferase